MCKYKTLWIESIKLFNYLPFCKTVKIKNLLYILQKNHDDPTNSKFTYLVEKNSQLKSKVYNSNYERN